LTNMAHPINYSFVDTKSFAVTSTDGTSTQLSVLVLDEEANDAYWRKLDSFRLTLEMLKDSDKPVRWRMNRLFADMAVRDIVEVDDKGLATIADVPVSVQIDETPAWAILDTEHTSYINTYW
jgi:hypothetical protein